MKIFLVHASEDKNAAEQIYLALAGNRHTVFFDRASLPAGAEYTSRIRQAILDSDLVLFLISPDSVAESSYTLTELAMAQSKWPHPDGAVLPVMIRDTEYERIPNYVKAVTILEPRGNLPADVVHEVATMAALRSHRTRIVQALSTYWLPLVAVVAVALIVSALLWSDRIGGRQMSREQMATELGEMKARLQTV